MIRTSIAVGLGAVGLGYVAKAPPILTAAVAGSISLLLALIPRAVKFLSQGEQLLVERLTETSVYNGPCAVFLNPFTYRDATRREALSLGTMDYVKVKDTVSGEERIERGPKQLYLGAYDQVMQKAEGLTLSKTEYIFVEDQLTGKQTTARGPTVWYPGPYDTKSAKMTATALQADEFIRIQDDSTGHREIKKGKDLVFLEPSWRCDSGVRKAWTLKSYEYVRLLDSVTGKVRVERGENTVFPMANEECLDGDKLAATELKANEYMKIMNKTDGKIRVVAGPNLVFLGASEKALDGGKKAAIEIDDEHAVLVRETSTGQLHLVTENQLFIPGPTETIEEVRKLMRLADHEAVIVKDKDGILNFHYGDPSKNSADTPRSFFLPPYAEIVKLQWSGGLRRVKRDLCIDRFDCRPQFMWNEIDCRTEDNVELVLETTIFWEVLSLSLMVRKTGNLPGDIYNQIRSQFIKHVAKVTLKGFMEKLHSISTAIFEEDPSFYESRGIKIHSLEVTKYSCAEKRTAEVLQQIIEEATNRLNRLSQAESENEVKIFKMQGQIEQEKLNGDLMNIQHEHAKAEAAVQGEAEAARVAAFVTKLEPKVPKLEDRMEMWKVLRKNDALSVVAEGGASLYYTPNDVDLSIKCEGKSSTRS